MANQFITTDKVAKVALASLANNTPFLMTGSRYYENEFTDKRYKIGETISIRRQNFYNVEDGETGTPQDIIQTVEPLTISHQYHCFISYTMQDLTLRIEDFAQLFVDPAIQEITTKMENDISLSAVQSLYSYVGSSTSPLNSYNSVDSAGRKLLEKNVNINKDCYMATSLKDGSSLKNALLSNFTPMFNEDIVTNSKMGHLSYFDMFQSQSIREHTAGVGPVTHSGDTLTVNGAVSSGSTIVLAGATGGVTDYFRAGDVISIAGVQSVYPRGRLSTGQNMQFIITQNANSTGGGAVTITVSPSIISNTANPLRNVTNAVPNGAAVTTNGSHNVNVAYISRGLDICCPPLASLEVPKVNTIVDPDTRLSLTATQIGDIYSYQNLMRIDVLCGFVWHPQYAVRVLSQL